MNRPNLSPAALATGALYYDLSSPPQDQLDRLEQAQERGFHHIVFDDNYIPGVGDVFSIKDACDGGHAILQRRSGKDFRPLTNVGRSDSSDPLASPGPRGLLRAAFARDTARGRLDRSAGLFYQRCTAFHSACEPAEVERFAAARRKLLRIASHVWEAPPIAPIEENMYASIKEFIRLKLYEGALLIVLRS